MSDVEWCQNCGDVVTDDGCACAAIPKPTGVLTREQLEASCREYERLLEQKRATIEQRDGQIEKLAAFIVLIPGEPSKSEGAVDTAIRIIAQQAQELGRCKSEKNDAVIELYRKLDAKDAELAASQARCRDMESKLASLREAAIPWLTFRRWANQGCFPDLMQSRLMDVFGEVKPATGRDKWFKEYEEQQAWARTQVNWTR